MLETVENPNENDLSQFQEKLLVIFGFLFGFRGNKEHTELMVDQITEGTYPSDHPLFANQRYRGVNDFKDKTHKLSTNNTYVRSEMDMGRFPVLTGEAAGTAQDIGGAIDRFLRMTTTTTTTTTLINNKQASEQTQEKTVWRL